MKQISILLLLLTSLLSKAQTVTWDGGGGNTNWHNPLNWDTNTVPCNTCTAVVDGAVVVNISANDTIKQLRVLNGAFFFIGVNKTLVVSGSNSHAVEVTGSSLSNNGLLKINLFSNRAISATLNSTLTNLGDIEIIANPGGGSFQAGLILDNSSFNNQSGSNLLIENVKSIASIQTNTGGSFVNTGELNINYCANTSILNNGNFENNAGGQINIFYSTDYGLRNFGTFTNRGDLSIFTVFFKSAVIKNAIGLYTAGTFTNTSTAALSIDGTLKYGMEISGNFSNDGALTVINNQPNAVGTSNGIVVNTDWTNTGSISIENIDGVGMRLISPGLTPFSATNLGSITIENTTENSLYNDHIFQNSGTININTSTSNGINNQDSLKNTGTISISKTTHNGIINWKNLINYSSGSINVSDIDSVSIHNRLFGNLINEGSIVLDSPKKSAVINLGNFNNLGGDVIIKGFDPVLTSGRGIESSGSLINSGDISIIKSNQEAVYLTAGSGSFLNESSGEIYIQKPKKEGIYCAINAENRGAIQIDSTSGKVGIVLNNSTKNFINIGLLNLQHCDTAITVHNGLFGNIGDIQIKHATRGIQNNDDFYNFTDGNIFIDSSNIGLYNTKSFINEGIYLGENLGFGIVSNSNFLNYKTIELNKITGTGILQSGSSIIFKNENNAQIHISKALYGISTSDTLINNGFIEIDSSSYSFILNSSGTLDNKGNIDISRSTAGSLITNYGVINNISGVINSHNSLTNLFDNYGTINNSQEIYVRQSSTFGLTNYGNGILNNLTTGIIRIDTITNAGLYNLGTANNHGYMNINKVIFRALDNQNIFNNYGQIDFENSNNALSNDGNAEFLKFTNHSTAIITYKNGAKSLLSRRDFLNDGTINFNFPSTNAIVFEETIHFVPNNADGDSFVNNGTINTWATNNAISTSYATSSPNLFLNSSSGVINVKSRLNISGKFKNEGLLNQKNASSVNVITKQFQNIGVFVDTKDIQNPDANFVNTGLLIKPLKGEVSVGIKEMNIVNRSGVTTFSPMATWYINPILSVTGGTFSAIDDSYTPNANAPFADTLYFNVSTASITRAVKIPILKTPVCSANPTATFTQAVSTDWHNPANWDTGQVPDYCTIAIIPNTKKCTITTGRKARAFRILSDTGSVFDAELGVVLEVENN